MEHQSTTLGTPASDVVVYASVEQIAARSLGKMEMFDSLMEHAGELYDQLMFDGHARLDTLDAIRTYAELLTATERTIALP